LRHAAETSSLLCVLLQLDAARRELLRAIAAHGIPIVALVLNAAADEGAVHDIACVQVHRIALGAVQQSLDAALGGAPGAVR
jgi:hypothetical protein